MPTIRYRSLEFLGYPGYRVGSDGSVWTALEKKGIKGRKGTYSYVGSNWRLMRPSTSHSGHKYVRLSKKGKYLHFSVHRLILLAFVGPCPQGMQCCHFPDRDPGNNNLRNLRWGTSKENQQDRDFHGTTATGVRNGNAVLDEQKVSEIKRLYTLGTYTKTKLGLMFGVSDAQIGNILKGKHWRGKCRR